MSEKQQHTSEWTRQSMLRHYGTEHHHKHDKRHMPFRLHCRSRIKQDVDSLLQHEKINGGRRGARPMNFQKNRKRLAKRILH